jgi:hypothetical protein
MKKIEIIPVILFAIFLSSVLLGSCATPEEIKAKNGAQLWAENCQRCHNTPPPNTFSDDHWEVVGTHMKIRANLTETEKDKIVEFLKSSN